MINIIKYIIYFIALIPIVVDKNVFFPFIFGKVMLFNFLILLFYTILIFCLFSFKEIRDKFFDRISLLYKNPLFLSVVIFLIVSLISGLFAFDIKLAFLGNVERFDGLINLFSFFLFLMSLLLFFEKKDWFIFLKISIVTSFILLIEEFYQSFSGIYRPDSYTGNTIFLAGYLLFSILSGLIIFKNTNGNTWKFLSILNIFLSIFGIFLTETRGTILGILGGVLVIIVFVLLNKNFLTQKIRLLFFLLLFSSIVFVPTLFFTGENSIFKKIPGISRFVNISGGADISTMVRIINYDICIKSINPLENGWKKFLIGWGPENFIFADGKYYDSEIYTYERDWHDKSHNVFLDFLCMYGFLGFLSYLLVWFFIFINILKIKNKYYCYSILFWAVSFFIHIFFAFNQLVTYIPFYFLIGYLIYSNSLDDSDVKKERIKKTSAVCFLTFLSIIYFIVSFFFINNIIPGYIQSKKYLISIKDSDSFIIDKKKSEIFFPFSISQSYIREDFINYSIEYYRTHKNSDSAILLNNALLVGDEYVKKNPYDFVFTSFLAEKYTDMGYVTDNEGYLKKGENYIKEALTFSPNRPNLNYVLVSNLLYQKRYNESISLLDKFIEKNPEIKESFYYYGFILYEEGNNTFKQSLDIFEKTFDSDSTIYGEKKEMSEYVYLSFLKYFYEIKDIDRVQCIIKRLIENNYSNSDILKKINDYIVKNNILPSINFNI